MKRCNNVDSVNDDDSAIADMPQKRFYRSRARKLFSLLIRVD